MAEEQRNRRADLDRLAEAFINSLQRSEVCYGAWGQEDKRPFGFSGDYNIAAGILGIIKWRAEGRDCGAPVFTEAQQRYAHALYDQLADHLCMRWSDLLRLELEVSDSRVPQRELPRD